MIYLVNPDGEFEHYFLQKKSAVEIAMYVQDKMESWNERKRLEAQQKEETAAASQKETN